MRRSSCTWLTQFRRIHRASDAYLSRDRRLASPRNVSSGYRVLCALPLGCGDRDRLLDAEESGEVEPLKERLHDLKAIASKKIDILIEAVWNQHILQRLDRK